RPQRDLPIGMLGSLAVSTLIYVVVSLVLTGTVHYSELSVAHPVALGIAVTGEPWLEMLVDLGALAGLTSGGLVMLLGQPRIFYAMSRDGLFPRIASRLHPRYRTPHVTTAVTGLTCALAGGLLPIDILGELTSIGTLFAFVLVSASVMVLRLRRPDAPRQFKVPGGPFLVPLASAAVSGALMCTATVHSLVRLFAWMALGVGFYAVYGRRHSKLRAGA
ncbi:MAG TPA: amino acid permease, partial [Myxococcota bacterium]|nr:amino acid permease [Myxococcota bacterium]